MRNIYVLSFLLTTACQPTYKNHSLFEDSPSPSAMKIGEINVPAGFTRLPQAQHSFGTWLRDVPLKLNNEVYLYNGKLKENQSAQFAVLNISVGKSDLQQCADAVMRLRAEFLLEHRPNEISFASTSGEEISFAKWRLGVRYVVRNNHLVAVQIAKPDSNAALQLPSYLQTVFSYCGTYSLQKDVIKVESMQNILPGDILLHAGFPGHAMLVADVVQNAKGEKRFLLAQSYMPAQDIHIVKNPANADDDPWYEAIDVASINTPEWIFRRGELCRFK